jgi:hypothetical protein
MDLSLFFVFWEIDQKQEKAENGVRMVVSCILAYLHQAKHGPLKSDLYDAH